MRSALQSVLQSLPSTALPISGTHCSTASAYLLPPNIWSFWVHIPTTLRSKKRSAMSSSARSKPLSMNTAAPSRSATRWIWSWRGKGKNYRKNPLQNPLSRMCFCVCFGLKCENPLQIIRYCMGFAVGFYLAAVLVRHMFGHAELARKALPIPLGPNAIFRPFSPPSAQQKQRF